MCIWSDGSEVVIIRERADVQFCDVGVRILLIADLNTFEVTCASLRFQAVGNVPSIETSAAAECEVNLTTAALRAQQTNHEDDGRVAIPDRLGRQMQPFMATRASNVAMPVLD